ncbi:rhamnose utilization protein RhaD (predicted bifunctional aldolase and dehydrogenase) [Hasllibacter halocynthiae]|uniref:Rhamnose utilization protein RhaD (Predicted bifunctional aldolase and dehydrogenase) n=1 Tax=Hasllibacter halocynthiae TaxID=595589 RepID=A0A2T0X2D2_9RHOB|nr:class II aldolase/adducin family protein [Hasllibacter halocynthiae]PRY93101.1 rhamnose utilization protein RhaD (predicted bifunctional aldolase and dehydrogenase) [Hasllibacter halocynthiae]
MSERDALRRLAARIGADPLQIQGPGGNVSLKEGGRLIVKASGTRLADALGRDVFAELDRKAVLDAYRAGADIVSDGPRPSIETSFHALIPHQVVIHTHSVNALAHLICSEGRAKALQKTAHLGAALVPYAMPGLPLTAAIEAAGAGASVHLLSNHGLVVGADTVAGAARLLAAVERALRIAPAPAATIDPDDDPSPACAAGWRRRASALAAPLARARAAAGAYWPDAAVFLGPRVDATSRPARVDAGGGLIEAGAPQAAGEMLDCLGAVLARVPEGWTPAPLPEAKVARLRDWEAEAFRRKRDGTDPGADMGAARTSDGGAGGA